MDEEKGEEEEEEEKESDGRGKLVFKLGHSRCKVMAKRVGTHTLGSQVSSECSHSELLNTLYTCSFDVDKNLGGAIGQGHNFYKRRG